MRALKILVAVMGVLLVGGTVVLVAAIIARIEHRSAPAMALQTGAPMHTVLARAGRVVATELSGDRLLVRVAHADGSEELVLFDAKSGAEVAVIEVPEAKSGGTASAPLGALDRSGGVAGQR